MNTYPISLQCQVLGVSRNGYYQYRKRRESKPVDPVHQEMIEWSQDITKSSDDTYGPHCMKKALNVLGYQASWNMARKQRRQANAQARHRRKYKVTTNSKPDSCINPAPIIKQTAYTPYELPILGLSLDFTKSEVQKKA